MAPVIPNPDRIHAFKDQKALEAWMKKHHDSEPELWLKVHKKDSGLLSVTIAEALDVMLCYGWIDAIRKSLDEKSYLQRYTPRGAKGTWSQINIGHVDRLTKAGRMTPAGQKQIDLAKADGRWDNAYAGSRTMEFPPDLLAAIEAEPKAHELFQKLTSQNRFALAFRLHKLKTEVARKKNIENFVAMLKRGETIYPNGKAK
jgi:uncharacterized protein YdeI (YjbR/CyaY-like superfamily)